MAPTVEERFKAYWAAVGGRPELYDVARHAWIAAFSEAILVVKTTRIVSRVAQMNGQHVLLDDGQKTKERLLEELGVLPKP